MFVWKRYHNLATSGFDLGLKNLDLLQRQFGNRNWIVCRHDYMACFLLTSGVANELSEKFQVFHAFHLGLRWVSGSSSKISFPLPP